jgi:hypothetical protein
VVARARVNIDYHVSFDSNLYSVPYNRVHELVEIRSTPTTVEILYKGTRVASHLRSRGRSSEGVRGTSIGAGSRVGDG